MSLSKSSMPCNQAWTKHDCWSGYCFFALAGYCKLIRSIFGDWLLLPSSWHSFKVFGKLFFTFRVFARSAKFMAWINIDRYFGERTQNHDSLIVKTIWRTMLNRDSQIWIQGMNFRNLSIATRTYWNGHKAYN